MPLRRRDKRRAPATVIQTNVMINPSSDFRIQRRAARVVLSVVHRIVR
jgi:hypothetical protein